MNTERLSTLPPNMLETQAAEQRRRIHQSVSELKTTVQENIREKFDPQRIARQHLWTIAAGASAFALLLGYGAAGMFTRR